MTTRKRLEGALADWHPHPKDAKDNNSLVPVVRDAGAPDEIAERFFETEPAMATPEPPIAAEPSPRRAAIDSAAVRARRRYLTRYVAGAVSIAGVIGLAAIVRMTTTRDASAAASPAREVSAIAASQPVVAVPAVARAEPGIVAADPIVAVDPPEGPAIAVDPPVAADPPGADVPAAADPQVASAAVPDSPPDEQASAKAREARIESQRALDRGHFAASIEAGEQSVALDPTDADAWLILGGAYQKQGHFVDARRCFASCAEQARRGARWECRALLR